MFLAETFMLWRCRVVHVYKNIFNARLRDTYLLTMKVPFIIMVKLENMADLAEQLCKPLMLIFTLIK